VAEELFGSEGGFVEVDGFGSVADGEERGARVVFVGLELMEIL
jgi:hypothetical protein